MSFTDGQTKDKSPFYPKNKKKMHFNKKKLSKRYSFLYVYILLFFVMLCYDYIIQINTKVDVTQENTHYPT